MIAKIHKIHISGYPTCEPGGHLQNKRIHPLLCKSMLCSQGFPNFFITKKYHQFFGKNIPPIFWEKNTTHTKKWLYYAFFGQKLSKNEILWYFFRISWIWWYFLYLKSNKWWYFFQNGRIFLEKNTTKFENPLAHIKNTLRAHPMCPHITLGSPVFT